MTGKEIEYYSLVEEVNMLYPEHDDSDNEEMRLESCSFCKEINLWTYWQGRGHVNSAKVLLVGQDWGCVCGSDDGDALQYVKRMNDGEDVPYISPNNKSKTNHNLKELFVELGYKDIFKTSTELTENKELFFTNLVTGYRSKGTSGNLKKSWIDDKCKDYFKELVKILEPEIIICLGQYTYEGVLGSLNLDDNRKFRNYNEHIEAAVQNPVQYTLDKKQVMIFPVAHCGSMGTLNRARNDSGGWNAENGMKLQKKDWRTIKLTWKN